MFCQKCGREIDDDSSFCVFCGEKSSPIIIDRKSKSTHYKILLFSLFLFFIFLLILFIFLLIFYYSNIDKADESSLSDQIYEMDDNNKYEIEKTKDKDDLEKLESIVKSPPKNTENIKPDIDKNYIDLAESVVNIVCINYLTEEVAGGSGTIIDSSGLIITNDHIIPYFESYEDIDCLVTIPDPETGFAEEMYLGFPISIPDLSYDYDMAFVSIYEAYYDEDGVYGTYPKVFKSFDDSHCQGGNLILGERIRILGYPMSTGGYNLTITEGNISAFDESGFIYTSAKIDSGNSGGIAVDDNNCMIGIPSAVQVGNYENMGIVIPTGLLADFIEEAGVYFSNF